MLAVENLERLIEIESDLKEQYEIKLNKQKAEINQLKTKQEELQATIKKQLATISEQQQKMMDLSAGAKDTSHTEQLNRELNSRASKLQDEYDLQKKRAKSLQKELAAVREELKALKQLDPQKLKKNLDANKKKLAEKTAANETLQKSYNKFKRENEELKKKLKELEEKAENAENTEAEEEATAA